MAIHYHAYLCRAEENESSPFSPRIAQYGAARREVGNLWCTNPQLSIAHTIKAASVLHTL